LINLYYYFHIISKLGTSAYSSTYLYVTYVSTKLGKRAYSSTYTVQ